MRVTRCATRYIECYARYARVSHTTFTEAPIVSALRVLMLRAAADVAASCQRRYALAACLRCYAMLLR